MYNIGLYRDNGKEAGNYCLRLYRDIGKEKGNYCSGFRGSPN